MAGRPCRRAAPPAGSSAAGRWKVPNAPLRKFPPMKGTGTDTDAEIMFGVDATVPPLARALH
jgi:hypothetical protein